MNKETELYINKYLKEIKESLNYLSRSEIEDRLKTIKAHIFDALEDKKGSLSEIEIVKKAIKDLGIPTKPKQTLKNVLFDFLALGLIGIFIYILDFLNIPTADFDITIWYLVIIVPAAVGLEIWNYKIKPKLADQRYNLIYAWIIYPILIIELLTLGIPNPIPFIVILVYGILFTVFTVLSIVMPGEMLEKECPKCNEILPQKAKFCLNCGEELE